MSEGVRPKGSYSKSRSSVVAATGDRAIGEWGWRCKWCGAWLAMRTTEARHYESCPEHPINVVKALIERI